MRAYAIDQYGGLEHLRVRDIATPAVGDDALLVRVHGASLNPADWKVITGREGGRFLHAASFPLVPGFDFSGVVEKVGSHVHGVSIGASVFGFLPYSKQNRQGSFAEYVSVPASTVALKPAEVGHVEAACAATTASTALQALHDKGGLARGQRVLINGASGGVGGYAVQIAKNAGAEVWGTCSAAHMDEVAEDGADRVIDYRKTPIDAISGRFDIIFDAAAATSFNACRPMLNTGGAYITLLPSIGLLTGKIRALFSRRQCRMLIVKSRRSDLTRLAELMSAGRLRHRIAATYPFDQIPDALQYMHTGRFAGKIGIAIA